MNKPDKSEFVHVQWPSRNVPYGGIMHVRKTEYSPKTEQFLKVLLEESKMSIQQRQRVDWSLRDGNYPEVRGAALGRREAAIQYRPRTSKRRSYSAIRESGDYEVERWRPLQRIEDRDLLKTRLQDIMEFGREGRGDVTRSRIHAAALDKKKLATLPTKNERMDELLQQIRERVEWLSDMEALGEASPHRDIIRDQVAKRVREIEGLEPMMISTRSCEPSTRSESAPSSRSGNYRQNKINENISRGEPDKEKICHSALIRCNAQEKMINSSINKEVTGSQHHKRPESKTSVRSSSSRQVGKRRQAEEENIAALGELLSTRSFGISI